MVVEKKGPISYDSIHQIYQKERKSALLSKVGKDFYEDVAKLMKDLNEEYDVESNKGPSSIKTMVLLDELKKTRTLVREIYEYRIRKITLLALTAASEGTVDTKFLVPKELSIFEQLSEILRKNHEEIVQIEQSTYNITSKADSGKTSNAPGSPSKKEGAKADIGTEPVPRSMGKDADKAMKAARSSKPGPGTGVLKKVKKKLVAVQILEDLPKFMGEGGVVYLLKRKDYTNLPKAMAERLQKQGKARIMPS